MVACLVLARESEWGQLLWLLVTVVSPLGTRAAGAPKGELLQEVLAAVYEAANAP